MLAVLFALAVIVAARTPWRWLALAYPAVTTSVVVVTGNHYWLDAIVGVLLLTVAIAVVALVTRRPEPARGWSPASRAGDHGGGPGGRG